MTEGLLCNKKTIDTKEQLDALLADASGTQYYAEMDRLDVDSDALWGIIQKSLKSRLKTWLEICAHCGMCAEACHFYMATQDERYTPTYKFEPLRRFYKRQVSPLRWLISTMTVMWVLV